MPKENTIIEAVLNKNSHHLGKEFNTCKNHVYRVYNLCLVLDNNPENMDKYAVSAVFHDLGIWTAGTFDYLQPSINQAKQHLIDSNKASWIEEISLMIDMHHKRSKYKGDFEKTVEVFRKADWIDVTQGVINFNVDKAKIKAIKRTYPLLGFHQFLLVQSLKHFLKSPLNPLPMFKK